VDPCQAGTTQARLNPPANQQRASAFGSLDDGLNPEATRFGRRGEGVNQDYVVICVERQRSSSLLRRLSSTSRNLGDRAVPNGLSGTLG
jgi:hypothetical protein